jgi:hypothetical protein
VPDALAAYNEGACWHRADGDLLLVGNGWFTAAVDRKSGLLREVRNQISGQKYRIAHDQTTAVVTVNQSAAREWSTDGNTEHRFDVSYGRPRDDSDDFQLRLSERLEDLTVTIVYTLRPNWFWIERQLELDANGQPFKLDRIVYGRVGVPETTSRVLELGKFDRPRLQSRGAGGVFCGVGFWFYSVDPDGLYFNGEDERPRHDFTSEPWYVGMFQSEADEPWPGWLWYKTFLEWRKAEHDREPSWCYWNAGWGQWGLDINNPAAPPYIDLAARLGVRNICFGSGGSGQGINEYIHLAESDAVTKQNID